MPPATALIDFAFCLGLLTMLVASYGVLRRRLPGTTLAPQILGMLFGGVAVLMMYIPLPLADGVIVDLRVVPVVLAGAFLGLRGAMIAAGMATAMRLGVGGIGWFSGVASIWSAAAVGMLWSYATVGPAHRSVRDVIGLGAAACLTLLTAVLLPHAVAARFLAETAPFLAAVYLIVIPSLALLLEHQRVAMQREAWDRAAAGARAAASFDGAEGLTRALALAEGAGRFEEGAVVLALRVRSARLALSLWGAEVEVAVLHALRDRLAAMLPPGAQMGMAEHGTILIFLEPDAAEDPAEAATTLCAEASAEPFAVPGMASVRLRLDGRGALFGTLPTLREVAGNFEPSRRGSVSAACVPKGPPSNVARLFKTADRLFEIQALDRMSPPVGRRP